MKGKKMYRALNAVEDRFLTMAENYGKEGEEKKRSISRKSLTVLLAAAICVSMLAVTAVASGWVPGIFRSLEEQYPEDKELFEAAAQANTEVAPEPVQIPKLDLSQFVMLETYYDGETILMGYNLDLVIPEPMVGIQPDEMLLRKIRKSPRISQIGWDKPADWLGETVSENAKKYHLAQDAFMMDQMMQATLSEEAYEKAWQLLETQGWVCLATREVSIGDHILINGLAYYDPVENPDGLRADYITDYGDCIRLEVLPQAVRNLDAVDVTLKIGSAVQYWYMDLEGNGWCCWDETVREDFTFRIEREDAK